MKPTLRRLSQCLILLVLAFFAFILPVSAYAQAFGEVTGTTMDESKAVVPNTQVQLTNLSTGTTVTTKSNGEGIYVVSSVQPGQYKLVATAPSFGSQIIEPIVVSVSKSSFI